MQPGAWPERRPHDAESTYDYYNVIAPIHRSDRLDDVEALMDKLLPLLDQTYSRLR